MASLLGQAKSRRSTTQADLARRRHLLCFSSTIARTEEDRLIDRPTSRAPPPFERCLCFNFFYGYTYRRVRLIIIVYFRSPCLFFLSLSRVNRAQSGSHLN